MNLQAQEYFSYQTDVGRFYFFLNSRLVGEFYTPLPLVGNLQYFCRFCGEIFAKRVVDRAGAMWDFLSGSCLTCAPSIHHGAWQSFLLPGEEALDFAPAELLAAEFLFNTRNLEILDERSSSCYHSSCAA